jgi:hypothetical protein
MLTKKELDKEATSIEDVEQRRKDKENIDQLKKYKKRFEPRWYLANAFYEGIHFTYTGQRDKDGNWARVPSPKGRILREIPKAKKQLNAMRTLILKTKQRPVTYPDRNVIMADANGDASIVQQEETNAIRQARYIEWLMHEKMKIGRHLKKLVRYAEMYNVGFIQILNDNDKKEFAVYDPFEISIYPTISNINEYPRVCKHISKRIDDLVGNDLYDQTVVKEIKDQMSGGKYSDSVYKQALMMERYGNAPKDICLVDEMYEIKKVKIIKDTAGGEDIYEEIEEQGDPEEKTVDSKDMGENEDEQEDKEPYEEVERVVIKAYVGEKKIREEVTKLSRIPISMFCWGDEAFATSVLEDLMPLNKVYDTIISKLEQKAKKMDTGRILLQKGEDTKVITTNDAEFIRWKRVKPEVMQEAGVSNAFLEFITTIENDIRESGTTVYGMSNLPQGVKTWRAIEALKEVDYASMGIQMDNLNECLTDITEKLIEMVAYDLVEIEKAQIPPQMNSGKSEQFNVIGKRGAQILGKTLPSNTVIIDPGRTTKVEIESDVAYTEQGVRETAMQLVGEGLIDQQTALEMLKVGNTQEIIDRLQMQSVAGKSMVDAPDFQMLPPELQQALVAFLAKGGTVTHGGAPAGVGGTGVPPIPSNAMPADTNPKNVVTEPMPTQ